MTKTRIAGVVVLVFTVAVGIENYSYEAGVAKTERACADRINAAVREQRVLDAPPMALKVIPGTATEEKWRRFNFRKEVPDDCRDSISKVRGVNMVSHIARYALDVQIGDRFTWAETLPRLTKAFKERCGLEP